MATTSAESEATDPASICRSKAVRAATATPKAVGQRCFSTSVQRRGKFVCSILPGLLPLAFVYTPRGYIHHGPLYPTCQGADHEPPRRKFFNALWRETAPQTTTNG